MCLHGFALAEVAVHSTDSTVSLLSWQIFLFVSLIIHIQATFHNIIQQNTTTLFGLLFNLNRIFGTAPGTRKTDLFLSQLQQRQKS